MFEVTYNPVAGTATWLDVSYDLGDIPITDVARDDVTGDLYAASDFGVFRLVAGTTVGRGGSRHAERGSGGTDDRPGGAQAVRRDARPERVDAQPAVSAHDPGAAIGAALGLPRRGS